MSRPALAAAVVYTSPFEAFISGGVTCTQARTPPYTRRHLHLTLIWSDGTVLHFKVLPSIQLDQPRCSESFQQPTVQRALMQ
jgi:hypothetical protein